MDIARPPKSNRNRNIMIGVGVVALVAATVALSRMGPASQTIDRAAVLIDTVKQGDVVREVRGNGTLAPERIRCAPPQRPTHAMAPASEGHRS